MKAIGFTEILYQGKYTPLTKVKIIKANEIIPAVIAIEQPDLGPNIYCKMLHEPKDCPECKSKLEKVNDQLFCRNEQCPAKVVGALVHMAKRDAFDIEGLSEETAVKLVNHYTKCLQKTINQIKDLEHDKAIELHEEMSYKLNNIHPSFIFDLNYSDLLELEGFAKKSAEKLYNNIQKAKTIDLNKFIYGCGMPLIGRSVSKDIAAYYSTKSPTAHLAMATDCCYGFKGLIELEGIGETTVDSFYQNWESCVVPYGDVIGLNIKNVEVKKKAANQLIFVITGKFDIGRDEIKANIESAGHKVSGSVSKKTTYLLASPGEESTSKYTNAITLGVNIINTLEELEEIING